VVLLVSDTVYVVGGGPGGSGAAYAAGRLGYRVVVFEAHERLAVKPCGRGVPVVGDFPFSIPREVVLNRIRYVDLHVDGVRAFKAGGWIEGVIVDKGALLEHIFSSVGAEVLRRSKYNVRSGYARVGGDVIEVRWGVFSGGFPYYDGERIPVVQYIVDKAVDVDLEAIEIRFDTSLLGYYYVFPHGDQVEVGVGGFADYETLWGLLGRFLESDYRFRGSRIVRREAAMVSVGGLRLGYINRLVKVGEASGFVLPLTGEGIRPSFISGYIAMKALLENRDPVGALRSSWIGRAVRIQRRLLEWAKSLDPQGRRRLLLSLSPEEHAEIALGALRIPRLARSVISKPRLALSLLARILGF
jgi:digeranylgeranylglycerophospholipid reductase